jgi:hypothetical protein
MDVAIVDTETTGLRRPWLPGGRRTWEVAVIRQTEDGELVDAVWLQITDVDLSDADPKSLAIGRFFDRWSGWEGTRVEVPAVRLGGHQVRLRGVEEAEAAPVIERLTRDAVIAASNPGFDVDNFAELLWRNGQPADGWWHHPLDVPNLAHGWLRGMQPGTWTDPSYSTRKLSEAVGVPEPADRHSAWADAVWMRDLYAAIGSPRPKDAVPDTIAA